MRRGQIPSHGGLVSQTAVSSAYTPRGYSSFMGDPARAPFRTWVEDRQLNPNGFDNQRLDAIPDRTAGMGSHRGRRGLQHGVSSPQLALEARRRHTPCSIRIDPAWDMDTLYLRGVEEERYEKTLAEFTANAPPSIDADLHPEYLLLSRPSLPRTWLTSGRKTLDPERKFPRRGQVHLLHEAFARDSGYAFYISILMEGEGDPGRFTDELCKEHKNRRTGVLLSWAQVEYYHLPPGLRKNLYPQTSDNWAEWECPAGMAVPLPAVVTYRGSRLIKVYSLQWRIFYAEWLLNATVRFITDAHHRGLLWRLPRRVIDKISVLGLPLLLEGTCYDMAKVTQLLGLVRSEDWTGYEQVGALPIQLVRTNFTRLAMDIPLPVLVQVAGGEVTVTEEDEVEEIVAIGGPPGQSPRGKGVSPAIPRRQSGQLREERIIPRSAVPEFPPSTKGGHNMVNPLKERTDPGRVGRGTDTVGASIHGEDRVGEI
jgi:hypothetical protein